MSNPMDPERLDDLGRFSRGEGAAEWIVDALAQESCVRDLIADLIAETKRNESALRGAAMASMMGSGALVQSMIPDMTAAWNRSEVQVEPLRTVVSMLLGADGRQELHEGESITRLADKITRLAAEARLEINRLEAELTEVRNFWEVSQKFADSWAVDAQAEINILRAKLADLCSDCAPTPVQETATKWMAGEALLMTQVAALHRVATDTADSDSIDPVAAVARRLLISPRTAERLLVECGRVEA